MKPETFAFMHAFHSIWLCYELVRGLQDLVDLRGSPTLVVIFKADLFRYLILLESRECMVMKMLNRSRSNIRIGILLLQYRNGQYASRFCLVLFSNLYC